MINNSEKLFRAFLGELKIQMTSAIREPKLPVLAGCLKGLSSLMCNFTKSMEEDPQTSREIFDFALKAIRPQLACAYLPCMHLSLAPAFWTTMFLYLKCCQNGVAIQM